MSGLYRRAGEPVTNPPYRAMQYGYTVAAVADHLVADFAKGVIKAAGGGRGYLEIYQDALTLRADAGDWIVKNPDNGDVQVFTAPEFVKDFIKYEIPVLSGGSEITIVSDYTLTTVEPETTSYAVSLTADPGPSATGSYGTSSLPRPVSVEATPPRETIKVNAKYLDGTPVTEHHLAPAPPMVRISCELLEELVLQRAENEPYAAEGSLIFYVRAQDFYQLWEEAGHRTSDEPDTVVQ